MTCALETRLQQKEAVLAADPMPHFRSVCRGRSRPMKLLGPSLTVPGRRILVSIGSMATQVARRQWRASDGSRLRGPRGMPIRSARLLGRRSFRLALSITKPDPDAGHARRLIERTEGLAEPGPELGSAVLGTGWQRVLWGFNVGADVYDGRHAGARRVRRAALYLSVKSGRTSALGGRTRARRHRKQRAPSRTWPRRRRPRQPQGRASAGKAANQHTLTALARGLGGNCLR
jgi:hypothetical protein